MGAGGARVLTKPAHYTEVAAWGQRRLQIAEAAGLPAHLADWIQGDSEAEMQRDAARLAAEYMELVQARRVAAVRVAGLPDSCARELTASDPDAIRQEVQAMVAEARARAARVRLALAFGRAGADLPADLPDDGLNYGHLRAG